MDIDELIHKLAEDRSWSLLFLKDEDAYRLTLPVPDDRHQDVFVNFREDEEGWWIATMWSVVASLDDFDLSDPKELLRFNWRHMYGSLAVKDDEVVLVHNQLADDADWNEVARAIDNMARTADGIEKQIYGDADER